MAPSVTTLLSVARTGTRVARFLIRPARRADVLRQGGWGLDTLPPALALRRRVGVARRAAGLGVLTLLGLLGASLLTLSTVFLGLGIASGSDSAGWVLGLVLLLGVLGAVWLSRRASALLRLPAGQPGLTADPADLDTLAILHRRARRLPAAARSAYRRTLDATALALRACAPDTTLGRDTYDARQAAREDLPALLGAYAEALPGPSTEREFTRQLALIETRMQDIVQERAEQQRRDLYAHGQYLEEKYIPRR